MPGLRIKAWRSDPILAFVPAAWQAPEPVTPNWLAAQPLILNDDTTQLAQVTRKWFATAEQTPRPRIELNYNDAIKSLVAAGYGAALLPQEAHAPVPDERMVTRTLHPPLWRPLGIAHREGAVEQGTQHVLDALQALVGVE
jgi:DNA-binding transcriptional LysR family regulator